MTCFAEACFRLASCKKAGPSLADVDYMAIPPWGYHSFELVLRRLRANGAPKAWDVPDVLRARGMLAESSVGFTLLFQTRVSPLLLESPQILLGLVVLLGLSDNVNVFTEADAGFYNSSAE